MKDYLKTLKQEKPNCFFIGIAVLLTLTLCLSSCSKNQKTQHQTYTSDAAKAQLTFPENSSAILYVNQRLGFSAELPLDWIGQVEIKEEYGLHHQNGGNCITFYHKPTHDNGEGGILFFIDCYPGEWSEDNPPAIVLLLRKRKTIHICSEHRAMSNTVSPILRWQKPTKPLLRSKILLLLT